MTRALLAASLLVALASACRGGVDAPSSRFCQETMARLQVPPERQGEVCNSCCHQDVVHRGRMENGRCACYP